MSYCVGPLNSSWLLPQDRFDQGAYRRSAYGAARDHVTIPLPLGPPG